MDPLSIPLLGLAQRRLSWVAQRERVLAENVANIDTPGYRPKDLAPFAATLSASAAAGTLARTDPAHLSGTSGGPADAHAVTEQGRLPDGNQVSLDKELEKIAGDDSAQQEVTAIYQSYLGLFRTALGQGNAG